VVGDQYFNVVCATGMHSAHENSFYATNQYLAEWQTGAQNNPLSNTVPHYIHIYSPASRYKNILKHYDLSNFQCYLQS